MRPRRHRASAQAITALAHPRGRVQNVGRVARAGDAGDTPCLPLSAVFAVGKVAQAFHSLGIVVVRVLGHFIGMQAFKEANRAVG